jgi:TolA-binding protein
VTTAAFLVASQRASLELGQAFEAQRNTASACAAYAKILARWPDARGARTSRAATERLTALGCPKKN